MIRHVSTYLKIELKEETAVGAVQQRRDAAAAVMRSSYTSLGIRLMLAEDVQDEEDELLCMASRRSRLMSSIFSLTDIGEAVAVRLFRFRREDIHTLVDLVVWPSALCSADGSLVSACRRHVFTKEEALCVLLGRL